MFLKILILQTIIKCLLCLDIHEEVNKTLSLTPTDQGYNSNCEKNDCSRNAFQICVKIQPTKDKSKKYITDMKQCEMDKIQCYGNMLIAEIPMIHCYPKRKKTANGKRKTKRVKLAFVPRVKRETLLDNQTSLANNKKEIHVGASLENPTIIRSQSKRSLLNKESLLKKSLLAQPMFGDINDDNSERPNNKKTHKNMTQISDQKDDSKLKKEKIKKIEVNIKIDDSASSKEGRKKKRKKKKPKDKKKKDSASISAEDTDIPIKTDSDSEERDDSKEIIKSDKSEEKYESDENYSEKKYSSGKSDSEDEDRSASILPLVANNVSTFITLHRSKPVSIIVADGSGKPTAYYKNNMSLYKGPGLYYTRMKSEDNNAHVGKMISPLLKLDLSKSNHAQLLISDGDRTTLYISQNGTMYKTKDKTDIKIRRGEKQVNTGKMTFDFVLKEASRSELVSSEKGINSSSPQADSSKLLQRFGSNLRFILQLPPHGKITTGKLRHLDTDEECSDEEEKTPVKPKRKKKNSKTDNSHNLQIQIGNVVYTPQNSTMALNDDLVNKNPQSQVSEENETDLGSHEIAKNTKKKNKKFENEAQLDLENVTEKCSDNEASSEKTSTLKATTKIIKKHKDKPKLDKENETEECSDNEVPDVKVTTKKNKKHKNKSKKKYINNSPGLQVIIGNKVFTSENSTIYLNNELVKDFRKVLRSLNEPAFQESLFSNSLFDDLNTPDNKKHESKLRHNERVKTDEEFSSDEKNPSVKQKHKTENKNSKKDNRHRLKIKIGNVLYTPQNSSITLNSDSVKNNAPSQLGDDNESDLGSHEIASKVKLSTKTNKKRKKNLQLDTELVTEESSDNEAPNLKVTSKLLTKKSMKLKDTNRPHIDLIIGNKVYTPQNSTIYLNSDLVKASSINNDDKDNQSTTLDIDNSTQPKRIEKPLQNSFRVVSLFGHPKHVHKNTKDNEHKDNAAPGENNNNKEKSPTKTAKAEVFDKDEESLNNELKINSTQGTSENDSTTSNMNYLIYRRMGTK